MLTKLTQWTADRFSETSTWRGLLNLICGLTGAVVSDNLATAIVGVGVAAAGLVNVIRKEHTLATIPAK